MLLACASQPSIILCVCEHSDDLRDILRLARCCRRLRDCIDKCFPELQTIRTSLPIYGWQLTMGELLRQHPQRASRLIWQGCFGAALRRDRLTPELAIKLFFKDEKWSLLHLLIDCVRGWKRIAAALSARAVIG